MKMKLVTGVVAPRSGVRSEHFYDGELKVVNDEAETDNPNWIQQLRERGYKPIDEMNAADKALWGEVYKEEEVGTQVVDTFEDYLEVEPSKETKEEPDDNSQAPHVDQDFDLGPSNEEHSDEERLDEEPSDLELMMAEAMGQRRRK